MIAEVFAETELEFIHFIPRLRPNAPLRGHTSKVRAYIKGRIEKGVVVDLGLLKKALNEAVGRFNNKLLASGNLAEIDGNTIKISWANYVLILPLEAVVLFDEEPTIELIAMEIAKSLIESLEGCPEVVIEIYESYKLGARVKVKQVGRDVDRKG